MADIYKESPFQPGHPVDPEKFKGRKEIITKICRYMQQATQQKNPQHFFITGKRGMGKSSLATYIKKMAKRKFRMVGVHLYLDGVHDVESLIQQIIERLLNEIEDESWSDRIFKILDEHIESVGLLGSTIKFKPSPDAMASIKNNFPLFLEEFFEKFDNKQGILIIIDDINGLTSNNEFANWYKSFADTMSTEYRGKCPVFMMLSGYPEKLEELYDHNPSFNRIFHHGSLDSLRKEEVIEFFSETFDIIGMKVEDRAMQLMTYYCSGLPTMMHEIGDAVFWEDEDSIIDEDDAVNGIIEAGMEIGRKHLKPAMDKSIRSPKYQSIFRKLGESRVSTFRKKNFEEELSEDEKKVFGHFLVKARELNILEFKGSKRSGYYTFTNKLYPLYFAIQSLKED